MTELKLQNLFFALWPDAGVRAELVQVQQAQTGDIGRMHHPDDLHMTLVFLGRVSPEQMPCIRQVAATVVAQPFTLELTKTDYWSSSKTLWCGPEHTPELLEHLVHDLQHGLIDCGLEPERRVFNPHVTLVRKASLSPGQRLDRSIIWSPHEFVLAGSYPGAKPPHYRVLDRWAIQINA